MSLQNIKKGFIKSLITILVLVLLVLYGVLYYLGYYHGIKFAESNKEKVSIFDSSSAVSITVTPIITKTNKNTKVIESVSTVSWGGPELWEAVNKGRIKNGVNPLSKKDELCTIASIRLNQLLELGKLDGHVGFSNLSQDRPDLKWIFDRYTITEFLAQGGKSAEETVSLWEHTLGHSILLTGGEYVWGCTYAQNTFSVAITAY